MSLRLPVYISSVNNLSDARYCAGMGVTWLGFNIKDIGNMYSENDLKGMMEWVEGVSFVLETPEGDEISESLKDLFDIILSPETQNGSLTNESIKFLDINEYLNRKTNDLSLIHNDKSARKLDEEVKSQLVSKGADNIILGFGIHKDELDWIESELKPAGIMLKGGKEERPGFKTFDELADILEILEED